MFLCFLRKTFGLFTSTQGDFDAAAANEPDLAGSESGLPVPGGVQSQPFHGKNVGQCKEKLAVKHVVY
jgi:hypothetical protein